MTAITHASILDKTGLRIGNVLDVNDRRGREGFEVWFGKLKAMAA